MNPLGFHVEMIQGTVGGVTCLSLPLKQSSPLSYRSSPVGYFLGRVSEDNPKLVVNSGMYYPINHLVLCLIASQM